MSAREHTEWAAFERVYGPLLLHERMDFGFARLNYYLVSLLGRQRRGRSYKLIDFLPKWWRDLLFHRSDDPRQLGATLEMWSHANTQHPDG